MSAVEDVGGLLGSRVGGYAGGAFGGAVGELFGPEAVPLGAWLGSRAGSYAGNLAGRWLASKIHGADEKADDGAQSKPACATCGSKPGQTCSDDRLRQLEKAKDNICNNMFTNPAFKGMNKKRLSNTSCADIRKRMSDMRACRDARQQIQDECFGGKPDPIHKKAIDELNQGLANLKEWENRNCAAEGPGVS